MSSGGTEQRGAGLARRELHFYWLLDTSGSMEVDGKIASLNEALRAVTETIREAADHNAKGDLIIHAIQFDDGARWVNADFQKGIRGRDFEWPTDLAAKGMTDLGLALEMVAEELKKLPNNAFLPVICLVTDGQPSDRFEHGLQKLFDTGWGQYAFRIAIAIGDDADLATCKRFSGPEIPVLKADTAEQIKGYIRWVSNHIPQRLTPESTAPTSQEEVDRWVEAGGDQSPAPPAISPTVTPATPPPDDEWVNP